MPPRIIDLIPVMLDKERHLLFDRTAVKVIEVELTRIWGREYTFYQVLRLAAEMLQDNDFAKLSFLNISVLLWAGCLHEDPQLTRATVEEALPYTDPSALIPYLGFILQAWHAASPPAPEPQDREVPDSNPLAESPGTPSGALSVSVLA
jgi:hypothetical protein